MEIVAAKVNGRIITNQEVFNVMERFCNEVLSKPIDSLSYGEFTKIRNEVIRQLIGRELIMDAAEKENITVPDEEVATVFSKVKSSYSSEKEFKDFLERSGLKEEDVKEGLKKDMILSKMIEKKVEGKVEVNDQEVREYYEKTISRLSDPEKMSVPSFDSVKNEIADKIRQDKSIKIINDWIQELMQEADIQIMKFQQDLTQGVENLNHESGKRKI